MNKYVPTVMTIDKYVELGKIKEIEFAECLVKHKSGTYTVASKQDDITNHIDIYWNGYGFDVKGLKKRRRADIEYDETLHYVEMMNVIGKPGWLYGKATYFAFETNKQWIVVSQSRLIDFVKEVVDYSELVIFTSDFYKCQRRRNRQDIFTKVKTSDLINISNLILDK